MNEHEFPRYLQECARLRFDTVGLSKFVLRSLGVGDWREDLCWLAEAVLSLQS